jgi:hypothetical protein
MSYWRVLLDVKGFKRLVQGSYISEWMTNGDDHWGLIRACRRKDFGGVDLNEETDLDFWNLAE